MYEKTLVHKAATNWEKKYKELQDKYDKLAFKVIVHKLYPQPVIIKHPMDNYILDFSIRIFPHSMSYDSLIQTCIVPQLTKELKKLNLFDK